MDPDVLAACWSAYADVREQLNPIEQTLDEPTKARIEIALENRQLYALRSFGTTKLALYMATEVPAPTKVVE